MRVVSMRIKMIRCGFAASHIAAEGKVSAFFISVIIRERFDYTKWRKLHFDGLSADEFNDAAVVYGKAHPFKPVKEQIKI